jgi:hypothetical protein
MDQISPPMRIALAVAVLFGAVYMLVLKPGGEKAAPAPAAAPATAPASASASDSNAAHTGLGKAVEAAHGAAATTEQAQAASSGETASAPSTTNAAPAAPATSAPATSASKPADESLADLPKWLQDSMDHKVIAILFTNGKSADDRRTQVALKHAYKAGGKVVTRAVPISKISKYRPVAQGVDVQQSPTLMVIDRARGAQALVGYASVDTINQAVIDGLLATDRPVKTVKYLQTVQHECRQINNQSIIGETQGDTVQGARKNIDAVIATMSSSQGKLRNAPVPAGYKAMSKDVNHYIGASLGAWKTIRSVALDGKVVDTVKIKSITRDLEKTQHKTLLELNAVGVGACN